MSIPCKECPTLAICRSKVLSVPERKKHPRLVIVITLATCEILMKKLIADCVPISEECVQLITFFEEY